MHGNYGHFINISKQKKNTFVIYLLNRETKYNCLAGSRGKKFTSFEKVFIEEMNIIFWYFQVYFLKRQPVQ